MTLEHCQNNTHIPAASLNCFATDFGRTKPNKHFNKMLRIKSVWSYAIHAEDFLAISENFENFHVELASQPIFSYRGGGELNMAKK